MRIVFLLILLLSLVTCARAETKHPLEVRFVLSEPCGLSVFVETLAHLPHNTEWLIEWHFKRSKTKDQDKKICEDFSKFFERVDSKYRFKDNVGREMELAQKLSCVATECTTLDELYARLKPLLQEEDLRVVKDTYEYFAPYYHDHIWLPRLARLKEQRNEFERSAAECRMTEKLEHVRSFFATDWPADIPFTICLVPLPDEKKLGSHGESIGTIQILELYPDYTYPMQSATVFHELCHAMWERSTKIKMLEDAFAKTGGSRAFDELNESLATAIGSGWFGPSSFPNEKRSNRWYDNKVINSFAQGLSPITSDYLNHKRSIDLDFVKNAIRIFKEKCPSAYREITSCHAIHLLIHTATNEQLSDLPMKIRKLLPNLRKLSGTTLGDGSLLNPQNISSEFKNIVLISPLNVDDVSILSSREKARLKRISPGIASVKRDDNEILFCVADKFDHQEKLVVQMLKKKTWPSL